MWLEGIGRSYEGRRMYAVRVCFSQCKSRKIIFIEIGELIKRTNNCATLPNCAFGRVGIHSREWGAISTGLYMLSRLTDKLTDADRKVAEKFSWYFVPVVNVDGYVKTWEGKDNSDNRFWRKNRNPSSKGSASCGTGAASLSYFGVDLNRNFDIEWEHASQDGDPCSETFRGDAAFSEYESANVRDYATYIRHWLIAFTSIHTFGQLILMPWSFTNVTYQHHNELYWMLKKVGGTGDRLY